MRPDNGTIRLDDRVLFDAGTGRDVPVRKRAIGTVFQEGRLFPHYSVRGNLMYGRRRTPRRQRWGSFDQIVELLGIGDLLDRRPAGLSGGEKQRVAIGRALLQSPRLLIMDEPLAALDMARKEEILPYIERLRDEMKLDIVYVSHSVDEVARLADTLVLLAGGKAIASGTVNEVFGRLDLRPHTGRFEASMVLSAEVIAHDAESGTTILDHPAGRMWIPTIDRVPGSQVRLRVRAREVAIAVGDPGLLSIRNRLDATVTDIATGPRRGGRGAARLRRSDAGGAHHPRRGRCARHCNRPAGRGADQVSRLRPPGRFFLKAYEQPRRCLAPLTTVTRTEAVPELIMPILAAAPRVRSITRPRMKGPRSLMRTTTERPLLRLSTRTRVPKGGCDGRRRVHWRSSFRHSPSWSRSCTRRLAALGG